MLFIVVVALTGGYWVLRLADGSRGQRQRWRKIWPVACVIGVVRITAVWLGAVANRHSDWRQVIGYFLQMLALPEIYLLRGMRDRPYAWTGAASMLLAVTSFFWAALLVRLAMGASRDERPPGPRA